MTLIDTLYLVTNKKNDVQDIYMQCILANYSGRILMIESDLGCRVESNTYSLMTYFSLFDPTFTYLHIVNGDDRYERAKFFLDPHHDQLTSQVD